MISQASAHFRTECLFAHHLFSLLQGQTSIDSTSPDDESGTNGTHTAANNIPDPDSNQAAPDGDDILAALEKIPGVGSLRSSVQSSLGSSLPSLTLDRVKREESSHSLESTSVRSEFTAEFEK